MAASDKKSIIDLHIDGITVRMEVSKSISDYLNSPQIDEGTKRDIVKQLARQARETIATPTQPPPQPSFHKPSSASGSSSASASTSSNRSSPSLSPMPSPSPSPMPSPSLSLSPMPSPSPSPSPMPSPSSATKVWLEKEVKALISVRGDMEHCFNAGRKDHPSLWATVATQLGEMGVHVTVAQITNKWNQLKRRYREVKDHNAKSGNDRKVFQYEEPFDNMYGERAATRPAFTLDSAESRENEDVEIEKAAPAPPPKRRRENRVNRADRQLQIAVDLVQTSNELVTELRASNVARLQRMDRFLDIYERSVEEKKNKKD